MKPTIVVIVVNNLRELRSLEKHYNSLGWKSKVNYAPLSMISLTQYPLYITYSDEFTYRYISKAHLPSTHKNEEFISFAALAELKGLEVEKEPVKIAISSDVIATIRYQEIQGMGNMLVTLFDEEVFYLTEDDIQKISEAIEEFKAQKS